MSFREKITWKNLPQKCRNCKIAPRSPQIFGQNLQKNRSTSKKLSLGYVKTHARFHLHARDELHTRDRLHARDHPARTRPPCTHATDFQPNLYLGFFARSGKSASDPFLNSNNNLVVNAQDLENGHAPVPCMLLPRTGQRGDTYSAFGPLKSHVVSVCSQVVGLGRLS